MGEMMLARRHVVSELLKKRKDAVVVSGLGSPTYDVAAVSPSDRNYYLWGAMGGAAMMGLGLALAKPDIHVIVITGDGEALMGMGSLATIGTTNPGNLSLVVIDNEHYGETGMQQSHLGMGVDLCGVAKSCGLTGACLVETEAELQRVTASFHDQGLTKFLQVKVDPESPPRVMPTRDAVENKLSFRAARGI
ncbi:MAG: thiamine pyrophosphate-dependent acetolactate synthase large subunit-like protein [Gammaproteobacteria bacterium]